MDPATLAMLLSAATQLALDIVKYFNTNDIEIPDIEATLAKNLALQAEINAALEKKA